MKEVLDEIVNSGLIPNPISFFAQLISTIVLFFFLKSKVWKPMQAFLAKRKEVIVGELESARTLNEEAKVNKAISDEELANIKSESIKLIDNAKKQAEDVRENIIHEAEKEAAFIIETAHQSMEKERTSMEAQLKNQLVDIAFSAAEKIIRIDSLLINSLMR